MSAFDLKRIKELESKNANLKRMYADMALKNRVMKTLTEKNLGLPEKRVVVTYLSQTSTILAAQLQLHQNLSECLLPSFPKGCNVEY